MKFTKNAWLKIVTLLVVVTVLVTAYLNFANTKKPSGLEIAPAIPAIVPSVLNKPTSTSSVVYDTDMISWKTYRNETYGFSFKYPPQMEFEEVKFGTPDAQNHWYPSFSYPAIFINGFYSNQNRPAFAFASTDVGFTVLSKDKFWHRVEGDAGRIKYDPPSNNWGYEYPNAQGKLVFSPLTEPEFSCDKIGTGKYLAFAENDGYSLSTNVILTNKNYGIEITTYLHVEGDTSDLSNMSNLSKEIREKILNSFELFSDTQILVPKNCLKS
jgi:hypothetical protein